MRIKSLIISAVIFNSLIIIGFNFFIMYENHLKHLKEIELLQEQKKTSLVEREKYEKQIILIYKEFENEKLKSKVYQKLN